MVPLSKDGECQTVDAALLLLDHSTILGTPGFKAITYIDATGSDTLKLYEKVFDFKVVFRT